ncbi:MAG: hypothetical protein ACREVE_00060 [Gammaproteobacteria bacterium]
MTPITPEMKSLKVQLKAAWMAGDYGLVANISNPVRKNLSLALR